MRDLAKQPLPHAGCDFVTQQRGYTVVRSLGFTLTELLIVIGIIVLLIGITLPMLLKAVNQADKTRQAADLQAVAQALSAYQADFSDFPRPNFRNTGAHVLCKALLAPGPAVAGTPPLFYFDGADGPGFRVRAALPGQIANGRVYGPYINAEQFKVGYIDGYPVLLDRSDKPILYYPAFSRTADITDNFTSPRVGGYINSNDYTTALPRPYYNARDNVDDAGTFPLPGLKMSVMLGDKLPLDPGGTNHVPDGAISAGETAFTKAAYVLWSAGSDGEYGPRDLSIEQVKLCDDVIVPAP